jgi:hypothetical protein
MANTVTPYTNESLVRLYDLEASPHHCGYCDTNGSTSNGIKYYG